jgi:hypothetical protein
LIARHTSEHFRVDDPERVFPNNFGDAWRIDAALGYSATALVDFFSLRGTGWQPCSNASSLLNIRYFVSRFPVPELEKVFDGGTFVYRNPRAVARAFVARRYRTFADDRAMLDWVAGPLMVPGETVLLRDGDRDRLPRSFWDETANDDEGIEVQLLTATKAAEKNAPVASDEETKRRLFLYQLPWGWSAGDEATVRVRPTGHDGGILLVLNYYPVGKELSRLKVQLQGAEESRELEVELQGLGQGEPVREQPKKHYVRLDALGSRPFRVSLRKGDMCSARIDSFRFARLPQSSGEGEAGTVTIISREPNRLLLSAKIERPSFVVFSEVFYPGWEALVDGQPAPVFAGDFILRAVPVLSGNHSIELRFRPRILLWGLIASLASTCMVFLLILRLRDP